MLPLCLFTVTHKVICRSFLMFSTISLHHRAKNKKEKKTTLVLGSYRPLQGTCYLCNLPARVQLYGHTCMVEYGCVLKGAGRIFHHLGTLNKLSVLCLCFDYNPPHEVKCGIFHLWHHVGTQKVLDFWRISD